MINLNKYYIAKKYEGPSGINPSNGGFVPPAGTGDYNSFLRADGTWSPAIQPSETGIFATIIGLNQASGTLQSGINILNTNLNQASGNLQSQIDILNVNSIAYAIALG